MNRKNDIRDKIIEQVAKNLGSTVKEVEAIVNAQSAYAKFVIEHGFYEGIAFPYLGKFVISPKKVKKINESAAYKRAKQQWDYSEKKPTRS